MTAGQLDSVVVRRHLLALERVRLNLERHKEIPLDQLEADLDRRWAVERGLQLCAQNALDIATHLAARAGLDSPDYTEDRCPSDAPDSARGASEGTGQAA